MQKGISIALIVIIVLVIIGAVVAYRSKNGTSMTFPDGTAVNLNCAAGGSLDVVSAQYAPTDGSSAPIDVMPAIRATLLASPPKSLTVSAAALGAPTTGAPGALTAKYRCVGGAPQPSSAKSPFSSIPFISCDRSDELEYGVDATVRGGTALVWAPYVLGGNFEEQPKKNGTADDQRRVPVATGTAEEISELLGDSAVGYSPGSDSAAQAEIRVPRDLELEPEERARVRKGKGGHPKRERFEPVPLLPCNRPTKDAVEYRVDSSIRGAPVPQKLLYSTIVNLPPARGVQDPLETESDNTVTHLASNVRVRRWEDPYLTNAAAFGKSPYDIPPGDPGSLIPVTDFIESFEAIPGADLRRDPGMSIMTKLTGRSTPLARMVPRSRDIGRFSEAAEKPADDGFSGSDSDYTSARFNRPAIQSARSRGRR